MPIPPALADYSNEAELTQDFLIPLFIRLGFLSVLNYHGSREFGKDFVVFEYDKLGNAVYHGVQAKHVPSVPISSVEELVQDVSQAFFNSFRHPLTGDPERISRFFIVNSGTVSDQAREHFYNSISKLHGTNVVLIDGKALLALDQRAIYSQQLDFRRTLSGIAAELLVNTASLQRMKEILADFDPQRIVISALPIRVIAAGNVLAAPPPTLRDLLSHLEQFWQKSKEIEVLLHTIRDPTVSVSMRAKDVTMCMRLVDIALNTGTVILKELESIATKANVSLDSEVQPFLPMVLHEGIVNSHAFGPSSEESPPEPL